ncbi:MAG TPA: hypothetical protein VF980_08800 [Thermoanaerobaculia bacterium]
MKRLHDLRPADLRIHPVWRYEGEIDEVATVRATDHAELSDEEKDIFIAATQFVLANGAQHIGFCTPSEDATLDSLQPVIVTVEGHVYFWFDQPPSREALYAQWRLLGAADGEIFPVHFRCTVPLNGNYVTGVIEEEDLTGAA